MVCPETEELELIDHLDSPLGPLIHGCSRFRPPAALACGRACARAPRIELAAPIRATFDTGELEDQCPDDTDLDIEPAPGLRIELP
ncbi:MAG: hypothetical protein ABI437_02935 [Kofleriaceae bacterium]